MNTNELAGKVRAVNAGNKYAVELHQQLAEIFKPLVGKQLTKADGGLLAKYAKLLPEFPYMGKLSVYKIASDYSLAWAVKTCEVVGGHAIYHETGVYVGDMRNGMLLKLHPCPNFRSDYTVEEVQQKQEALNKAEAAFEEARSAMHPFGKNN